MFFKEIQADEGIQQAIGGTRVAANLFGTL
jgi:hypothetical protein